VIGVLSQHRPVRSYLGHAARSSARKLPLSGRPAFTLLPTIIATWLSPVEWTGDLAQRWTFGHVDGDLLPCLCDGERTMMGSVRCEGVNGEGQSRGLVSAQGHHN
jgi:hypothetical protein